MRNSRWLSVVCVAATLAAMAVFPSCGSDNADSAPVAVEASDAGTRPIDSGPPTAVADDASADASRRLGPPIVAPDRVWTWVPFPDAVCANGQPTGIGVNLAANATAAFVYFEGGGACWDEQTCYDLKTAAHIENGYDEAQFTKDAVLLDASDLFARKQAAIFGDASFVFVPYCTGDVFAGDREQVYGGKPTKHVGRRNVEAFLSRLGPTFAGYDRVVLAGSSAGGFGANIHWWRATEVFAPTRVDLVDDSGPFFRASEMPLLATWNAAWDLAGAAPPGCTECLAEPDRIMPFVAKAHPGARAALLSFERDNTISKFFLQTQDAFASSLSSLISRSFTPEPNMKAFVVAETGHVLLPGYEKKVGDLSMGQWLGLMLTDDPSWATVTP